MQTSPSRPDKPFLPASRDELIASRSRDFGELLLHRALAGDNWLQAGKNAPDIRLARLIKGSVPAISGTDADALLAYTQTAAGWLESLRANSAFDAALPSMRNVPALARGVVVTTAMTAGIVAEGVGKPLTSFVVDASEVLQPRKAVAMTVVTQELLRQSARELLDGELRRAVSYATDATFLAELISGTTPIASTDPAADFAALLAAIDWGANSKLFFVIPPAYSGLIVSEGQSWPDMGYNGGQMAGITTIVSDALPAGSAVLFDADQLTAFSGEVTIDASSQTAIEMFDPPTLDSTVPTAASLVSMYSTNSIAFKVERFFSFQLARTSAVASLSGVAAAAVGMTDGDGGVMVDGNGNDMVALRG